MKVEAFIPAVLLLCFGVMLCLKSSCALQIGNNNELKNYISWEDLRVVEDGRIERSFSIKENSNWVTTNANANANATNVRRVIVVDKNGGGDSVTVQGAVDMVPDSNSQRVKIFILPGIYR
jgi:pectinesterase